MTPELFLAAWGAVVATILAVREILDAIRDRPDIRVDAVMSYAASSEGRDTHGTLFLDGANKPPAWKEANIEITVSNHGEKAAYVSYVFVEDEANAIQIVPEGLPCEIPPKASKTFYIQPEVAALRGPSAAGDNGGPLVWPLQAIGVVDGLRKKYFASQDQLDRIVRVVQTLPLRFVEDRTGAPGVIRWAVPMKDEGRFFSKVAEFVPTPMEDGWPKS